MLLIRRSFVTLMSLFNITSWRAQRRFRYPVHPQLKLPSVISFHNGHFQLFSSSAAAADQCDQIGQFIGLWTTLQSLWQHLICLNLQHWCCRRRQPLETLNIGVGHFSLFLSLFLLQENFFNEIFSIKKLKTSQRTFPVSKSDWCIPLIQPSRIVLRHLARRHPF